MTTFGNVQTTFMKDETIHWLAQVLRNEPACAFTINVPYTPTRSRPAKGKARFSYVDVAFLIKCQTGWKRESINEEFDGSITRHALYSLFTIFDLLRTILLIICLLSSPLKSTYQSNLFLPPFYHLCITTLAD
jgi:hypothetical protein